MKLVMCILFRMSNFFAIVLFMQVISLGLLCILGVT